MAQKSSYKIGDLVNGYEIVDIFFKQKNNWKVKCKCGNVFSTTMYRIKNYSCCSSCKNGFFAGKIIDGITFLEKKQKGKENNYYYKMKCFCGKEFIKIPRRYKGRLIDCGCSKEKKYIDKAKKIIGLKRDHSKIIGCYKKGDGHNYYKLKCRCGKNFELKVGHLFKAKSCGCLRKENRPRDETNQRVKLKKSDVLAIREFYQNETYQTKELAEMFSVTENYIIRIAKGFIWKNLYVPEENKIHRSRWRNRKRGPKTAK